MTVSSVLNNCSRASRRDIIYYYYYYYYYYNNNYYYYLVDAEGAGVVLPNEYYQLLLQTKHYCRSSGSITTTNDYYNYYLVDAEGAGVAPPKRVHFSSGEGESHSVVLAPRHLVVVLTVVVVVVVVVSK